MKTTDTSVFTPVNPTTSEDVFDLKGYKLREKERKVEWRDFCLKEFKGPGGGGEVCFENVHKLPVI